MNNNPIGVFDSGIGGLSVLNQIIKLLPNEKYIYYADTDNVPYGLKTKEQILEYENMAKEKGLKWTE
jgi:glutamate racemase